MQLDKLIEELNAQIDGSLDTLFSDSIDLVEDVIGHTTVKEKRQQYFELKFKLLQEQDSQPLREFLDIVLQITDARNQLSYLTGVATGLRIQETVNGGPNELLKTLLSHSLCLNNLI